MRMLLENSPLVHLAYVILAHAETLEEVERLESPALVSLAARIGKARLIDNLTL